MECLSLKLGVAEQAKETDQGVRAHETYKEPLARGFSMRRRKPRRSSDSTR